MFNFKYFLKIIKSSIHLIKIDKKIKNADLNRILCNIIENNISRVRIIIPQCLFYAKFVNEFALEPKDILIDDWISHVYFLHIFEIFLKFEWNNFFQALIISLMIVRHDYFITNKHNQNFIDYFRTNYEIIYLKFVFFMRFRYEINKIFIFLAMPFLEEEVINNYTNIASLNNIYTFVSLNKFSYSKSVDRNIFLAENHIFDLSPLFFATIHTPENPKKLEDYLYFDYRSDNQFLEKNNDLTQPNFFRFCDFYVDDKELDFVVKEHGNLRRRGAIDFRHILIFALYFEKIKIFTIEPVQKKISNWINKIRDDYNFEAKKFTKFDKDRIKRIDLTYGENINHIRDLYIQAYELLKLTSSFFYGNSSKIEKFLDAKKHE